MRLIDADALIKEDLTDSFVDFYDNTVFEAIIENSPTVDIKTEVAREIFAEIEGTLKATTWLVKADFSSTVKERELKEKCCRDFLEYITELKNKYTKEGVEVRHGEWIEQIRDYGKYQVSEGFKCSICGCETMDNDKKYCSECGAKMDGERSNTLWLKGGVGE